MPEKYIESLGRCGVAALQDPLLLFFHRQADGIEYQVNGLLRSSLVSNDAVVIEIAYHGEIQHALLGMDIGNIRYPFRIGTVCMELAIEQIFIAMYLLSQVLPLPAAAYFRQQAILFHDSQHRFRIFMNILLLQPQPYSPVSVGFAASLLAVADDFSQIGVIIFTSQLFHIVVVATSGYTKERTHLADWILTSVHINYMVLCPCPHFLSSSPRKSRSSSFSIFRRSISCSYSSICVNARFRGLPFFCLMIP